MSKIEIADLNLYYDDFQALKSVNLNIEANRITAFIGPSGCGKSTLLKTLNRMNDLVLGCRVTGSVTLDGEDIYGDLDVNLLRKRVGMVFQKPNPFPMYPIITIFRSVRKRVPSAYKRYRAVCASVSVPVYPLTYAALPRQSSAVRSILRHPRRRFRSRYVGGY